MDVDQIINRLLSEFVIAFGPWSHDSVSPLNWIDMKASSAVYHIIIHGQPKTAYLKPGDSTCCCFLHFFVDVFCVHVYGKSKRTSTCTCY